MKIISYLTIRNISNSAFETLLQYNSLFATTVGPHITSFNLCSAPSSMQTSVARRSSGTDPPIVSARIPLDCVMTTSGASGASGTTSGLDLSLRSGFASKEVL